METTAETSTANAYARSLLELANESGQADEIGRELTDLRRVLTETPSFRLYLSDPGVTDAERTAVLDRVLRGKVSPLLWKFLGVLNEKGRLGQLTQLAEVYDEQLELQKGTVEVDVTVAQPLAPDQLDLVRQRVSQALGKSAIVKEHVDESIIGGLILRVGDKQIDSSVRYQLGSLKQRLMGARAR